MPIQEPSDRPNAALPALLGRPRTVLEVDCGAGIHGMEARRQGARVVGIEFGLALSWATLRGGDQ